MIATELDLFTRAYILAALFFTNGDDGLPLDYHFCENDISPETLEKIVADCAAFQRDNAGLLELAANRYPGEDVTSPDGYAYAAAEYAGHDFFLTRCRHGAGFWDRGLGEVGERLTAAAHAAGEVWFYVGDDGQIYC